MLTYRTGVAGGQAAAKAMAEHLLQQTLPAAQLDMAAYYAGQQQQTAEALAEGMGSVPIVRGDISPELSQALGLKGGALVNQQALTNILSGLSAGGEEQPGAKRRMTYADFTFSVPKAVSVAWMAAGTEAERQSILQAARNANDKMMRYLQREIGIAGFGDGRKDGEERGHFAWITVTHFTSRPTLAITRPDPVTGVIDTELVDVMRDGMMPGDPQLHFHNVVPNVLHTESGRFVALNLELLNGRIHEFGAVGQAFLGAELEAIGISTALDERTRLLTLPCVPEEVCREFSKRTEQAEDQAREIAREAGHDWDSMDADRKVALLKGRAQASRRGKGDDLGDVLAWQQQVERLGWQHTSAVAQDGLAPAMTREQTAQAGYEVGRVVIDADLQKRAVLSHGDLRLAAARGLIASRGARDSADVDAVVDRMVSGTVLQDGQETRLMVRDIGQGRTKVTTELHRDQEADAIRLARAAAADTSRALKAAQVEAAVQASGLDFSSEHGQRQRGIIDQVGQAGAVSVFIGAAGMGKTSRILPPLVAAWQAQGRNVWGTAQAWRQAGALTDAGIERLNCRALQPLLDGIAAGRTKLTANSVVVLDEISQVGTRQLLHLLQHRERIGFQLVMTGGERQCQSIHAGPVIELLREALGAEAIPEILTTVRQQSEREREIAGLFQAGSEKATSQAIGMLRDDGHAELVPGGYQNAVARVAELYLERRGANRADPDCTVTVSAPTNRDALNIGVAIRERLQASGEVSRAEMPVQATDGRGNLFGFNLAGGDLVRLYQRTYGVFTAENGTRRPSHVGDNGSVLRVVEIIRDPKAGGIKMETESGKVGFVSWDALRDKGTGRLKLALGYCLTIDSAQGITSDEHISAMPSGSSAVQAFKAYSTSSRHRLVHWMIGSHGAELREASQRRPQGATGEIGLDACWANVARNLARAPMKELATDMLAGVRKEMQQARRTFHAVARQQQAARAVGQPASRLRSRMQTRAARQSVAPVVSAMSDHMQEKAMVLKAAARALPRAYQRVHVSEADAVRQFSEALRDAGLVIKGEPVMDGKWHRAQFVGERGRKSSASYVGYLDGLPAGAIRNHKTGDTFRWHANGEHVPVSPEQATKDAAERRARQQERERAAAAARAAGADKAAAIWAAAKPADPHHPYLVRKSVQPHGIRQDGADLIIPLRDVETGKLVNIQRVTADGQTRFLPGAQKKGAAFVLGDIEPGRRVYVAEGFATAATVREATGCTAVMALDGGNLAPVARALRNQHPDQKLAIAGDNDHHLPRRPQPLPNVGQEKAQAAAAETGAAVAIPAFRAHEAGSDWNDFAAVHGLDAVRGAVEAQVRQQRQEVLAQDQERAPKQDRGLSL